MGSQPFPGTRCCRPGGGAPTCLGGASGQRVARQARCRPRCTASAIAEIHGPGMGAMNPIRLGATCRAKSWLLILRFAAAIAVRRRTSLLGRVKICPRSGHVEFSTDAGHGLTDPGPAPSLPRLSRPERIFQVVSTEMKGRSPMTSPVLTRERKTVSGALTAEPARPRSV